MDPRCSFLRAAAAAAVLALLSCGGDNPPAAPAIPRRTIGGSVSGLASGALVVLRNNGTDDLTITANGPFMFATQLAEGTSYTVTVFTQPASQTCTVAYGTGQVGAQDVADVSVSCAVNTFTIGGTVTGLAASTAVTLQNNGGDNLVVDGNGGFTFPHRVADGGAYRVTVYADPAGRSCTVQNGDGEVNGQNVTNVIVTCAPLCTTGVCCDAGQGSFRPSSFPCTTSTSYRCSSTACAAQPQSRTSTRYCSGLSAACDGSLVDGAWTRITDCAANQLCTASASTATCSTCEHGCSGGACWPQCNPADHCCSPSGTLLACWYDATSGLEWQNPALATTYPLQSSAIAYCQGLGAGWRLPTFAELRSLVRGCPAMVTGGSCGITSTCTSSTCNTGCTSCTAAAGGGAGGNYWPVGLTGPTTNTLTYYWSATSIPDRYNSTTYCSGVWVLNFRNAGTFWDWAISVNSSTNDYVVRCVKGP